MINKLVVVFCIWIFQFGNAQNVVLTKVLKMSENSDKFFYKIDPIKDSADYLGELEVQGFSDDDVAVFAKVYKKAKEIGANAFSLKKRFEIDGTEKLFDPYNYTFNLYYIEKGHLPKEDNVLYIINSNKKSQKIRYNQHLILISPRTYIRKQIPEGESITISTRKLLGTTINLIYKENQPVQFFAIFSTQVKNNTSGSAGLILKSGDIIPLERSYGDFLVTINEKK